MFPLALPAAITLLLGGVAALALDRPKPRLARGIGMTTLLAGVGLILAGLILQPAAESHSPPADGEVTADAITKVVLLVVTIVVVIGSLIDGRTQANGIRLWQAGLLSLAAVVPQPVIWWMAVLLTILPRVLATRKASWTLLLPEYAGSLLFSLGCLLLFESHVIAAGEIARSIGIVLTVCGLGGILGWFPFPRADAGHGYGKTSFTAVLGESLLPVLTACLCLFQIATTQPFTDQQQALMVVPALFSLVLSATRLQWENHLSRRFRLSILSTFSSAVVVITLAAWKHEHPQESWTGTSNIPGSHSLFLSLFVTETIATLIAICGCRLLTPVEIEYDDAIGGAMYRRPVATLTTLAGVLSLAGLPPFPGCWWRFTLLAACLLPHKNSELTGLTEPHPGYATLGVAFLIVWILTTLGHLRFVRVLFLEEPFRLREGRATWECWLAAVIGALLFAFVTVFPLSIAQTLTRLGP